MTKLKRKYNGVNFFSLPESTSGELLLISCETRIHNHLIRIEFVVGLEDHRSHSIDFTELKVILGGIFKFINQPIKKNTGDGD